MNEQVVSHDLRNVHVGASRECGKLPWVLLVIAWVLIFCTFSMPDRVTVSFDAIAKLKVATRLISLAILAVMLLWHWTSAKGASVIQ